MKKATVQVWVQSADRHFTVGGYHAFDMHGYSFVVHRKVESGGKPNTYKLRTDLWVVSETSCGGAVYGGGCRLRKEAVGNALNKLEATPKAGLDAAISRKKVEQAVAILGA